MKFLPILLSCLLFVGMSPAPSPKTSAELAKIVSQSVVQVNYPVEEGGISNCTGFVIDAAKGWVLTVAHCVSPKADITVNQAPSKLLKSGDQLALLSIEPMSRPPLDLRGDSPALGDAAYTMGYGFGILTWLSRNVAGFNGLDLALDGTIVSGMSGGPMVDTFGRVIGINQGNAVGSGGAIAYGCSTKEIKEFLKGL